MGFNEQIAAYGAWRQRLADTIRRYADWADDSGLTDESFTDRVQTILARLAQDKLTVAFVAEFSRGKSELINAIFFGDMGQRIVPSSAGRTTMCPTELSWDPSQPPSIRLLPIESRLRDATLADLRHDLKQWDKVEFDPNNADALITAFKRVSQTNTVDAEHAAQLGLYDPDSADSVFKPDAEGRLEISRWRHAIVNLPHPLLKQGLTIIDTPGLNAIGSEPELTFNLIPSAHAVLFVLAADAGVTRSDIEVWRDHVGAGQARLVVLNKIDGLWDALADDDQSTNREISRQVQSVASILKVPVDRIYPVSAQKALVAKVRRDKELLARSRIETLEQALANTLLPSRYKIAADLVNAEFSSLLETIGHRLDSRRGSLNDQLAELGSLRGKNQGVVQHMASRIKAERSDFEKGLKRLQALRSIFRRHSESVHVAIGVDSLKRHVRQARETMRQSKLSLGLRDGMRSMLEDIRGDFEKADQEIGEIATMMTAMYREFTVNHGFKLGTPLPFSMKRYLAEIDKVDDLYRRRFGAKSLLQHEKWALTRRFFDSIAVRVKEIYDVANREAEAWMRALMAPIEGQIKDHQQQLRRRLDSVKRVVEASENLDARINELEDDRSEVEQQVAVYDELTGTVKNALSDVAKVAEEQAVEA